MIELHLDLKLIMKPWKKALAFSFLSYFIILLILLVIVTIIKKNIDLKLISVISITYLAALTSGFFYMYKIFKYEFDN